MSNEEKKIEEQIKGKVIDSYKIKKLVDYLANSANGEQTEFRIVINNDGTGYVHVMNKDCNSLNFELPSFFKRASLKALT